MGQTRPVTVVLDAGALIAFERGDAKMRALCREAQRSGARLVVPAGVVGQAVRDPSRQVALRALLHAGTTQVEPLTHALAEACGVLCGRTKTRDVVDASVALSARRHNAVVVTSDPKNLRRLDAQLKLETV
ncbi:MAG TPA: PIN domain-containing protein [Polyangiaceae bacterium]|nr:PIN domain-containing protein [Polyangiaceae bacterium]